MLKRQHPEIIPFILLPPHTQSCDCHCATSCCNAFAGTRCLVVQPVTIGVVLCHRAPKMQRIKTEMCTEKYLCTSIFRILSAHFSIKLLLNTCLFNKRLNGKIYYDISWLVFFVARLSVCTNINATIAQNDTEKRIVAKTERNINAPEKGACRPVRTG